MRVHVTSNRARKPIDHLVVRRGRTLMHEARVSPTEICNGAARYRRSISAVLEDRVGWACPAYARAAATR